MPLATSLRLYRKFVIVLERTNRVHKKIEFKINKKRVHKKMIVRLNKSKSPAVKSNSILKWIIGNMTLELKLNGRTQDR